MKWLLIPMCLVLMAATPIYNEHRDLKEVDEEIRNLYLNLQPLQFAVVATTPSTTDLQDGQIVIFSSGVVRLMLLQGTTVYQVTISSVGGLR